MEGNQNLVRWLIFQKISILYIFILLVRATKRYNYSVGPGAGAKVKHFTKLNRYFTSFISKNLKERVSTDFLMTFLYYLIGFNT